MNIQTITDLFRDNPVSTGLAASITVGIVINSIAASLATYAGGSGAKADTGAQTPEVAREGHPGVITAIHGTMKDGAIVLTGFESEWTDARRAALLAETADEMGVPDWPGRTREDDDLIPLSVSDEDFLAAVAKINPDPENDRPF